MIEDEELNRYLEEKYVYSKAMENAKVYESSEGNKNKMINLKDIDPEKINYDGIEYIQKDDGTVFEKAEFEIELPNGEKTILTVDKDGNDMSCDFIDENGMSQTFILTPRMQEMIMKQAVNGKIQGNIDTETLKSSLFPDSAEEMEKDIVEDTLIPNSARETVEKIKEKDPNIDIEEVVSEVEEKELDTRNNSESYNEQEDVEKAEKEKEEEKEEDLNLPESIKDTVENIKEKDGSTLKHVLITKNPSSISEQLVDGAGIKESGEPVYCLQFRNGDMSTGNDRVVFVQGEKIIDDPKYYEDASRIMNEYKNSNVIENVEDKESKVYYTDIHGNTTIEDMKAKPRDLNSAQKDQLAEKLEELSVQEKNLKAQDKPLDEKIEDLKKINGKRLELFNSYGLEVPEIRKEIEADQQIHDAVQEEVEDKGEVEDTKEEAEEIEDDGRDPRESNNYSNGRYKY